MLADWLGRTVPRHGRVPRRRRAGARGGKTRLEALEDRALLSVCVVDRLTDLGEGKALRGDLRYCITQANQLPGDDTITFTVTGTINLASALPDLSSTIDMQGPGAAALTVRRDTGGSYQIFRVASGTLASIAGLTIRDSAVGFSGGGIANAGTLTVSSSIVSNNSAPFGGGILNTGTLTVNSSTISNNSALACGGGIMNWEGTLTISSSTVSNNSATPGDCPDLGGPAGGGLMNFGGEATIRNSTITGNRTDGISAGGIMSYKARLTISSSTISNNSAGIGGGIAIGSLDMRNTIVAGNTAFYGSPDLSGSLTSSGYNLLGNTSGGSGFAATDLLNVNPLLGPLQDNGGPTWTHALLPGSPALNAADPAAGFRLGFPKWDQRGSGFSRVVGGRLDIGAFEVQGREPSRVGNDFGTAANLGAGDLAALLDDRGGRRARKTVGTMT